MHPEGVESQTQSDESLMLALRGGHEPALGGLMGRWEVPVKAFLLRLGVSASEIEDLAQESFVRVYTRRDTFRPGARFKPWLLTIAANLARNRHRWWRRHPAEPLDVENPAHAGSERAGQAEQVERTEQTEALRAAIQALPAPLREAVLCVDLEEMSHAEAAEALGCTTKAVETRLHRARAQLRAALGASR
jgi:RNA polymerase sigma-70 factor (ECF subfamily)